VIDRYAEHGTSEPFPGALTTDRASEGLAVGKLATHARVLDVRRRAYNRLAGSAQTGCWARGLPIETRLIAGVSKRSCRR
jgi:hypothetical protein